MNDLGFTSKKVSIGVLLDTVTITFVCNSSYEAQVLYEDIVERSESGSGVAVIIPSQPKKVGL